LTAPKELKMNANLIIFLFAETGMGLEGGGSEGQDQSGHPHAPTEGDRTSPLPLMKVYSEQEALESELLGSASDSGEDDPVPEEIILNSTDDEAGTVSANAASSSGSATYSGEVEIIGTTAGTGTANGSGTGDSSVSPTNRGKSDQAFLDGLKQSIASTTNSGQNTKGKKDKKKTESANNATTTNSGHSLAPSIIEDMDGVNHGDGEPLPSIYISINSCNTSGMVKADLNGGYPKGVGNVGSFFLKEDSREKLAQMKYDFPNKIILSYSFYPER